MPQTYSSRKLHPLTAANIDIERDYASHRSGAPPSAPYTTLSLVLPPHTQVPSVRAIANYCDKRQTTQTTSLGTIPDPNPFSCQQNCNSIPMLVVLTKRNRTVALPVYRRTRHNDDPLPAYLPRLANTASIRTDKVQRKESSMNNTIHRPRLLIGD